jgi:tetratricopeptide (TPR) repeat protein
VGKGPVLEKALAACRHVLGDKDPCTLKAIEDLAEFTVVSKQLDLALPLHTELLTTRRETLGEQHPDSIKSMNRLAAVHRLLGDLKSAIELQEKVLALTRSSLGDTHPSTCVMMRNLGMLLRDLGALGRAAALHEEALEICQETLGERNASTLICISELVEILRERGELEFARSTLGSSASTAREVFGPKHRQTLVLEARAAHIAYGLSPNDSSVITELRNVTARMTQSLGVSDQQTVKYTALLCRLLERQPAAPAPSTATSIASDRCAQAAVIPSDVLERSKETNRSATSVLQGQDDPIKSSLSGEKRRRALAPRRM